MERMQRVLLYPFSNTRLRHALLDNQRAVAPERMEQLLERCKDWKMVWELALLTNQSADVLKVIVDMTPKTATLEVNTETRRQDEAVSGADPLSLDQAMALVGIFDKMDRIGFYHEPGWDCNAFQFLMSSLKFNKTLKKLDYLTLPDLDHDPDLALNALQEFLAENTCLTHLSVNLEEEDAEMWRSWVNAIEGGLATNTTLLSLRFNNWYGETKRFEIFWEASPRNNERKCRLVMNAIEVEDAAFAKRLSVLTSGGLDTLEIDGIRLSEQTQSSAPIVELLGRAPSLTTLSIQDTHVDILPIMQALRGHPGMKRLVVGCIDCDYHDAIFPTMVQSNAMMAACLDLVKHNSNMEECYPWETYDPSIQYYVCRNRWFRPTGTGGELIECLVGRLENVRDKNALAEYQKACTYQDEGRMTKAFETSITYEVLQENPGLWCHELVGWNETLVTRKNLWKSWKLSRTRTVAMPAMTSSLTSRQVMTSMLVLLLYLPLLLRLLNAATFELLRLFHVATFEQLSTREGSLLH